MDKIEYRAVIKFLTKQGKSSKVIRDEMLLVYGDSCPAESTIRKWSREFRSGRTSLEDEQRSGRPNDVITDETVSIVEKLVLEDGRLKKKQLAQMTGISESSILNILHDHLHMSKVSARWVPRNLSPFQKLERVETSKAFLELCGSEPDSIISRIVTGDETWVHHYDPESKQESMQWHKVGSEHPKKFKVVPSAGKVMATVFWDSQGILLIDYKGKDVKINAAYYINLLYRLRESIKINRRGLLAKGVLLLHDNASVHKAKLSQIAIKDCGFEVIIHPPYSPDLAPSDYYLFPNLKKSLRGKHFPDNESLKAAVNDYFACQDKTFFLNGINLLIKRCNKCIQVQGEYIEK
jgi:[histone H3]-lysine36 N-dimethyltransferase SETMAR